MIPCIAPARQTSDASRRDDTTERLNARNVIVIAGNKRNEMGPVILPPLVNARAQPPLGATPDSSAASGRKNVNDRGYFLTRDLTSGRV